MILRSIRLENIRSYENEKIDFPEGSVLLSGDIGSGKSTILLAIEFALFGIMRSGLTGSSLLRHGSNSGSVELVFLVDGEEYIVKRSLKRSKNSISQQAGYIIHGKKKFEGTPIELKAKILSILGYPHSILTRSKSLIYRYTVYTPQEEMKQILFEDKDVRLDTLRKVFGIDKYKTIKENTVILIRHLKRKMADYSIRLESFDGLEEEKQELEKSLGSLKNSLDELKKERNLIKERLEKEKKGLEKYEKDLERYREIKKEIGLKELIIKTSESSIRETKKKIENLETEISQIKNKLSEFSEIKDLIPEDELEKKLSSALEKHSRIIKEKARHEEQLSLLQGQISKCESEIKELTEKSRNLILIKSELDELKSRLEAKPEQEKLLEEMLNKEKKYELAIEKALLKIRESESLIEFVKSKDICPSCGQRITEEHRSYVIAAEKNKIAKEKEEKARLEAIAKKIDENIKKIKRNLDSLLKIEKRCLEKKEELIKLESLSSNLIEKQKELSSLYKKKNSLKEPEDSSKIKEEIESLKKRLSFVRKNNIKYREKANLERLIKNLLKNREEFRSVIEKHHKEASKAMDELARLKEAALGYAKLAQNYDAQKNKIEEISHEEKKIELKFAETSQEIKGISSQINKINEKLEKKKIINDKLNYVSQLQEWFESFFLKLASTMEKHIMVSIHKEFNSLLREWFSVLIEDIEIQLDDEFSVKIIQEGYETPIENLSGGEKTSAALAYRLALNKVINELIPSIKTKHLIILDEPTDGFSSEQLDKVRDVLEQLNMRQTIIVSHEPKMESFVDTVIKIRKVGKSSKAIMA